MVDLADFEADVADAAARDALRGPGVWRRAGFLDPAAAAGLAEAAAAAAWTPTDGYETAPAPEGAAGAFTAALARLGLAAPGAAVLIRHAPGSYGTPAAPGGFGCLLDLAAGWRSRDGGLLLVSEPEGSVHGWRPEPGALTLYDGARAPLLTMVAPTAVQPRYALFVQAEAL